MRNLTIFVLPCLLILGCPKDKSNDPPESATVLTEQGTPPVSVPSPSSSEIPYNDPFAGAVKTSTGLPDLGPAPSDNVSYEIMADTFYDWTPEQERAVSEKLGRQFEPFRSANMRQLVPARKADGWQRYYSFQVPGATTPYPNPFINATRHIVMYKRPLKVK